MATTLRGLIYHPDRMNRVATTVRRPQSSNWSTTQDKIGVIVFPASDYDVPEFIKHIFDWVGCSNGLPVANHQAVAEISCGEGQNFIRCQMHSPHPPGPELHYDEISLGEDQFPSPEDQWLGSLRVDLDGETPWARRIVAGRHGGNGQSAMGCQVMVAGFVATTSKSQHATLFCHSSIYDFDVDSRKSDVGSKQRTVIRIWLEGHHSNVRDSGNGQTDKTNISP
jgi:hypothetical protein